MPTEPDPRLIAYHRAYSAGEFTEAYRLACELRRRLEWESGFPRDWSDEARASVIRESFD